MKINAPVKINISELKLDMPAGVKVEDIKNDLKAEGAKVEGYRDEDGTLVMVISGDIELEVIEAVFDEDAKLDINDYIIDNIDLIDADSVDVFDNKNVKKELKKVDEKKAGCCPPKKKQKQQMVSLSEAFGNKVEKSEKKVSLDNLIDNMIGNSVSESVAEKAIRKAKGESSRNYLMEKLGAKRYNMVMESLQNGKSSVYSNVKVNDKFIGEYSIEELDGLLEKVTKQIAKLEAQVDGLNEGDEVKGLREKIEMKKKIQGILDDEISFRKAVAAVKEDEDGGFEFKNLNPNIKEDDEKKDDSDKDKKGDEDDANPDEDEEVELSSVVITLASKDSAEDLKKDLLDAGVPEDAIEIEPVEDETEDEEDSEESEDEENAEEGSEGEEKQEESVKVKAAKKVNEDDEDDADGSEDAEGEDDENAEGDAEEEKSDDESGAYKLVLTNTDYVPQLSDVLQDIWGMEKEEFEEMIGGEIVSDDEDDDSDESSDEERDSKDKESSEEDESGDVDDFDPEEIFKGL